MDLNNHVSFEDTSIAFSSKSDKQLKKMYLLFASMNNNSLVNLGTSFIKSALKIRLPIKGVIRKTIFDHFCGGETIEDSEKTLQELGKFNVGTILDYSVEGEKSDKGFEKTTLEILRTIEKAKVSPSIPFCVFKVTGLASSGLLEKVQSKPKELTEREIEAYQKVRERVDRICKAAHDSNVKIFVDAEESWIQNPIDQLVYEMMEMYNTKKAIVWNTFQMYRRDMLSNLMEAHEVAVKSGYFLGAKLVRGAYMEKERERATENGYPDPIQPDKQSTDDDFNRAINFCFEHIGRIEFCCASHNEYSNFYLTLLMRKYNVLENDKRIFFAQLYGMSDNISFNLANTGYNVAKYVPYGPVEAVMPYLFRRAEENTSISGQTSREFNLVRKEINRRKIETK
jgi:proline dehydrogenase